MHNYYILRHEDDLYCFYYSNNGVIMYREYRNNRWSGEQTIITNARENYSVTPAPDGSIYLFCQEIHGDIMLCKLKDKEWSTRVVLKNQGNKINTVVLSPIITEKGLSIIYNMPPGDGRSSHLALRQLSNNGQWSPVSTIDSFIDMNGTVYQTQFTSKEHLLLFYQTRTTENNLGYREITPIQQGNFNVFHSTNYYIFDSSFLTTNNSLHVLYIIKSMFSCQLIYRQKVDQRFSNPLVIFESQRIDNCLLTIVKNNLHITFTNGEQLMICTSTDSGLSFSRPAKYKKKICMSPIKANYISTLTMDESKLYIRQLYVDKSCPWDIQLIPDLYDDFFPAAVAYNEPAEPSAESTEELEVMRNQLSLCQLYLEEKDRQLNRLTDMLRDKNDEIAFVESQKKSAIKLMTDELTVLKSRLAELESDDDPIDDQPL